MSDESKTEYLGNITGNYKKPVNVHTINASELMKPVPTVGNNNAISLRIKLD